MNYSNEAIYDDQGMFFYATCKIAKWTTERVQRFLIKKYSKSHWNVLSVTERRGALCIMKRYAEAAKKERRMGLEKGLRQSIMAVWKGTGHEKEELHDLMSEWGFGTSLRACKRDALYTILDRVKNICNPVNKKKEEK